MTLDEYILRRCKTYVAALEKLASAKVDEKNVQALSVLVGHLRSLYRLRRSAFTPDLIVKINKFSEPGSNPIELEPLDARLEGVSGSFQVSKYYISQYGVFKVIAVEPFPQIEPKVYPKCNTPYFANYMLEEHNRIINERTKEFESANAFAANFVFPGVSAEAEISDLTEKYHLMIEENHREFLRKHGKPYLGTQPTSKRLRVTHCYSCKTVLSNDLYKECFVCGWIICSCGACGCGYASGRLTST